MARGWNALLTIAVALAGSLLLVDAEAAVEPPGVHGASAPAQPPGLRVAASGSSHAATGSQTAPPIVPGQPVGHSRRAEREAKRAARKMQRQMRRQEQQQEGTQQQTAPDAH
jgi:hypothetical protein